MHADSSPRNINMYSSLTEMSKEMCTEILGTESTESWSKEGESYNVSRERKERLSKTRSNPSVAYKNHSSPGAGRFPPLLGSISCPCSIRLIPRREGGRLILEAFPCLPHVKTEKNDGGQALEAVPSFPCIQAQKNDGRLRLYMPRSSPNKSYDNEEQEACDEEKAG